VRLSSWFNYFIPQFKYIVQQFFANPAMAGFRVLRCPRNGTKTAQHKKRAAIIEMATRWFLVFF